MRREEESTGKESFMGEKNYSTSFSYDDDLRARIESNLSGSESISQFVKNATIEKCNRMDKRNDEARKQAHRRDIEIFKPIIIDVIQELIDSGEIKIK